MSLEQQSVLFCRRADSGDLDLIAPARRSGVFGLDDELIVHRVARDADLFVALDPAFRIELGQDFAAGIGDIDDNVDPVLLNFDLRKLSGLQREFVAVSVLPRDFPLNLLALFQGRQSFLRRRLRCWRSLGERCGKNSRERQPGDQTHPGNTNAKINERAPETTSPHRETLSERLAGSPKLAGGVLLYHTPERIAAHQFRGSVRANPLELDQIIGWLQQIRRNCERYSPAVALRKRLQAGALPRDLPGRRILDRDLISSEIPRLQPQFKNYKNGARRPGNYGRWTGATQRRHQNERRHFELIDRWLRMVFLRPWIGSVSRLPGGKLVLELLLLLSEQSALRV